MTIDELISRLSVIEQNFPKKWPVDVHMQWNPNGYFGPYVSIVLTNRGVRTEIDFSTPVLDSKNDIIEGRFK